MTTILTTDQSTDPATCICSRGILIVEIQTTQAAKPVTLTRTKMIIRQIKNDWFRLDTKGLVFFGYSKEHVRHKLEAWVREYDLKKLR